MKMNIENRVEEAVRLVSLADKQTSRLTNLSTYGMIEELEEQKAMIEELDKKIQASHGVEKRGLRAYRSVVREERQELLEEYLSIEEFYSTVRAYERLYSGFNDKEIEEFNKIMNTDKKERLDFYISMI